ncbi:MAG: metallophosphoesterase family protein [Myxococcota bacterium]
MTSVAVLADIHANPFALEAVVADIRSLDLDEIVVAGDLVGRGPMGSAVVDRIAELGWPCIRGNHEDYMLAFCRRDVPEDWLTSDEWAASRWMAAELGSRQRAWIDALPFSTTSQASPPLRIVHGTPRNISEGIGTWTQEDQLDLHLNAIAEEVLVCAHTHRPLERSRPGGLIVNVGSVGLPFNGDPRAQYAVLHSAPETQPPWRVEFRQVEYDREPLLRAYNDTGFLHEGKITARMLRFEVETARPHLVPFLAWAKAMGHEPTADQLDSFFDVYDPSMSMGAFFARLKAPKPS